MSSKVGINCSWCAKQKVLYPSQIKNKKFGVFCNKRCLGKFRSEKLTGSLAANFKTGSSNERRYFSVKARWHPGKDRNSRVYLHRIIAEARVGRFLEKGEVVHHKDGNPENNHWENLEILTQSDHCRKHEKERDGENGRFI